MSTPVRVRIAPSPTGYFHVGNARTALFNWLLARQTGGAFVCRIEDTDRSRLVEGAMEETLASLDWLGIAPDESPIHGGPFGPYAQSERLDLYRQHAEQLLAGGAAYRCFCSAERLAERREHRRQLGASPVYDRRCRDLSADEVSRRLASGASSVVRLRVPLEGSVTMNDLLRGPIRFDTAELEDVVLVKADGFPTYHLAVVVDDHAMQITHVLRADEWIPSAPFQLLLYRAFDWPEPIWAHLPMVLNSDGRGKLSKRKTVDASGQRLAQMTQVQEYRAAGYLPEAMFNYLALQGWAFSGDEELFSPREAIARFRLADIKVSPAAWDPGKLAWMNGVYIRRLSDRDLAERLLPFLRAAGLPAELATVTRLAPLVRERLTTLADAAPWVDFVWKDVTPSPTDLVPKGLGAPEVAEWLAAAEDTLAQLADWQAAVIEAALRAAADQRQLKARIALQPVRVAITGRLVSPPLFESIEVIGRQAALARLRAAREALAAPGSPAPGGRP